MTVFSIDPEIESLAQRITSRIYCHDEANEISTENHRVSTNIITVPINLDLYLKDCNMTLKYVKFKNPKIISLYNPKKRLLLISNDEFNNVYYAMYQLSHYYLQIPLHPIIRDEVCHHEIGSNKILSLSLALLMPKETTILLSSLCNDISRIAYKFNVGPPFLRMRLVSLKII